MTKRHPMADFRAGMAVVMKHAVVERWWVSPGNDYLPPLWLEVSMGEMVAELLISGEQPWRVARTMARRLPRWRLLMPELVRAVLAAAGVGR